jgi:hypothetical protein
VLLAVVVVILLVLMATGYNNNIPYLHASNAAGVTIAGDRDLIQFQLSNGTTDRESVGSLCALCPFSVGLGAQFTYNVTVTNEFDVPMEVDGISTTSPFGIVTWGPTQLEVAGGLSQEYAVTVLAPGQTGVYTVPLLIAADVG